MMPVESGARLWGLAHEPASLADRIPAHYVLQRCREGAVSAFSPWSPLLSKENLLRSGLKNCRAGVRAAQLRIRWLPNGSGKRNRGRTPAERVWCWTGSLRKEGVSDESLVGLPAAR